MKNYFENNADIFLVLSHMKLTVLGPRLLSPAMLLFNRPVRGLLPVLSRSMILFDNNGNNHAAPIKRWHHANADIDTCKNLSFLHTKSTVAIQYEGGESWTHGTIVRHGSDDHLSRSY